MKNKVLKLSAGWRRGGKCGRIGKKLKHCIEFSRFQLKTNPSSHVLHASRSTSGSIELHVNTCWSNAIRHRITYQIAGSINAHIFIRTHQRTEKNRYHTRNFVQFNLLYPGALQCRKLCVRFFNIVESVFYERWLPWVIKIGALVAHVTHHNIEEASKEINLWCGSIVFYELRVGECNISITYRLPMTAFVSNLSLLIILSKKTKGNFKDETGLSSGR